MEEKDNKRKTRAILVIALAICLVTIATTAAYFVATINATNQEATITTGTMALTFADGDNGINEKLMFGESVVKSFTIENTGTLDAFLSLDWDELINTYIAGSLTYKLEYSEEENGTYQTLIDTTNVPVSEEKVTQTMISEITVPAGKKYYYNLTITLENLDDVDQTGDLDAVFQTKFTVDQPSKYRYYTLRVDPVGGTWENNTEVQTYQLKDGETREIADPTKEGYTFGGWKVTGLGNVTDESVTIDGSNITLTADWGKFNAVEAVTAMSNNQTPKYVEKGTPTFANAATTDEGVYAMADNYGTSYYYRGSVTNNYVNFAGFYWRIIRVNGDGSLRMIYDGTQAYANTTSDTARSALTEIPWNETNYNDAKYVGYMYGGANGEASTTIEGAQTNETSSNAKTQLEAWYKTNIEDAGYSKYLADVIFCNDRSTTETAGEWWTSDTTLGYGTNVTAYGAFGRFYDGTNNTWSNSPTPTFICPTNTTVNSTGNNDWFTAEVTTANKGNGALEYPVGLITADEIMTAGSGKVGTSNQSYYLYKGHWYWSFSPYGMYTNGHARVFLVADTGSLNSAHVSNANAVAPVINLSAEYAAQLTGTGTSTNPYQIPEVN